MSSCFSASLAPENGPNPVLEADNAASATSLAASDPRASLPQTEPGTVTLPEDPDPAGHELPAAPSGDGHPAPGGMDAGADEGITSESVQVQTPSVSEGPAPSTDAADLPDDRAVANDTTEAKAPQPSEHSVVTDSTADSSSLDKPVSDEEQAVPRLSKQALDSLLDELTAKRVALEAFGRGVDDRARENEWLGKHTKISLAVFWAELVRTGKYTFNVDDNGVLLDDPVKFRLAQEAGAQITLRVHHGLSEAKKSNFILLAQGRDRERTEAENRELKRRIVLAALLQGLTYEATAELAGVHPNTARNVEKRAAADPNSKLEITQRPDGRFKPETQDKIAEAAKLRKEGMDDADIAKLFDTNVEAVGKWFKDASARDKAKGKPSGDKVKKAAATKPAQPIEDIAARNGVPEVHRRALDHLVLDASAYDEWLKEAVEKAEHDTGAAAGDLEESVKAELYFTQRAEVEKSRQRKMLFPAGEADVEEAPGDSCSDGTGPIQVGDILRGIVKSIEPDKVFVAVSGGGGVIDTRDGYPAMYAPLKVKRDVRVRVEGFDRKRETWKFGLQGQQTVAPAPGVIAASSDRDERHSPDTKLAGLKDGPKNKGVTR